MAATGSKRVGNLLGNMLKKQHPKLHPEMKESDLFISLDELLRWTLWPNFIKIYGELPKRFPTFCKLLIVSTMNCGDGSIEVLLKAYS